MKMIRFLFLLSLLIFTSCSSIEYWECYQKGEKVWSAPLMPIDEAQYDSCSTWRVE